MSFLTCCSILFTSCWLTSPAPTILSLVPAPVGGARVGHGVPVVPVGGDLVHKWPILLAVVQGEPGGLPHGEDVHPVDLKAWYVVPSLVEVRGGCVPVLRSPHGVVVVLADKDDGQVPQLGQVEGFTHLPLVSSTVSIQGEVHSSISFVL